jgi:23S rRNA (guanosine2251-2'-O)-methyltransferase
LEDRAPGPEPAPWPGAAPEQEDAAFDEPDEPIAFRPPAGPARPARDPGGFDRPRFERPRYDRGRADAYPRRPASSGEVPALAEDEELVAGRRPVEEAFVARREAKRLLVVGQRRQALEKLVLHATSLRIPVVEVEGGTLTSIAGFDGHQGIALVVAPRRWAGLDDILAAAHVRGEPPLVLVLDSLEDPQNVGTLLRSAEASGVHGAIFPTHRQAPLTPAAIKASAGATEHLRLAPVDDLPAALADLHIRGLRIVGADGDALLSAREADLRGPVAIVVGSEGRGLGPAVRRRCDLLVRIPMHGKIESLNASVAGSILLYEAAAQRGLAERPPEPDRAASDLDDADVEAVPVEPGAEAAASPTAMADPVAAPEPAPVPEAAALEPVALELAAATPRPKRSRAKPVPADLALAAPEPVALELAAATPRPKRSRTKPVPAPVEEAPSAAEDLLPGAPTPD